MLHPLVSFERRFNEIEKSIKKEPSNHKLNQKMDNLWSEYIEYRRNHSCH